MGFRCDFSNAFAFLALVFLFLVALVPCFQAATVKADANIIRVPSDFPTIQEAINAAQNGSTILVDSGIYYEHVTINKTLTLLGTDKEDTIIDGSNGGNAITLTADNVLVDGFTVRNSSWGFYVDHSNSSVVSENVITYCGMGLYVDHSNSSVVSGNVITYCGVAGIVLDNSFFGNISRNIVSSTIGSNVGLIFGYGIYFEASANNTMSDNVITNCSFGAIVLDSSSSNSILTNDIENSSAVISSAEYNNTFLSNNFINILGPTTENFSKTDIWSAGGRGNYWSDYTGLDNGSGGRVAGDGVGDTNLPWHGVDYYPLINPVNPLQVFWDNTVFPVSLVSNSTVSAFNFDQADKEVTFNLNGPANTTGYFNLSTPTALLSGPWKVFLDGTDITAEAVITENQTYTSIYLNSSQITHSIQIIGTGVIPEYPTATALPLLTLAALLLLTVLAAKKRKKNKQTPIRKLQITLFSSK